MTTSKQLEHHHELAKSALKNLRKRTGEDQILIKNVVPCLYLYPNYGLSTIEIWTRSLEPVKKRQVKNMPVFVFWQ